MTRATLLALIGLAALFITLALASRSRRPSWIVYPLLPAAALAAVPGYFFGPNSGFTIVIAMVMVVLGLSTRTGSGLTRLSGWLVYAVLATGQGLVFALALSEAIPDRSLVVVLIADHPSWHHAAAHGAVQSIYLGAFLLGRVLRRRYVALAEEAATEARSNDRRKALLAEARIEYQAALASARQGILTGSDVGRYRVGGLRGRSEAGEIYDGVDRDEGTEVTLRLAHGPGMPAMLGAGGAGDSDSVSRSDSALRPIAVAGLETPLPVAVIPRKDGENLAERVARQGPLERGELTAIARAVTEAVAALHADGIYHLEITPEALRCIDGAWQLDDVGGGGPPTADVVRYSAPERFGGVVADHRADIYGLAACLYLAASGMPPFADVDGFELERGRELPEPPDTSEALAAVLMNALAPAPEARHASIAALLDALLDALQEPADEPVPEAAASSAAEPSLTAWQQAYIEKLQAVALGITALCLSGAVLFAVIIRDPWAKLVALVGFFAMIAMTWLHRSMLRSQPITYWPWTVVALLSAGPAFAIGFNTGFASAVAVLLFVAALFESGQQSRSVLRPVATLGAATGAMGTVVVLVLAGIVPDVSNVALRQPGAPLFETIVVHALLVIFYVAAFVAGRQLDKRYEELSADISSEAHEAAKHEHLLSSARAEIGRLLEGKSLGLFSSQQVGGFSLGRLLGRGGMGEVYSATHVETGIPAAFKIMRFDRASDPAHLERFKREALTLGQIESPHVARILDVGDFDAGLPYIAMEFIDGGVLSDMLSADDRLDLDSVRALVADIGAGLADVHRADILHRDIKPQNIILTGEPGESEDGSSGLWKLVDFGIAALGDSDDGRHLILGTPRYMSPEQAAGDELDARSDLYSLCLVAYRALTGCPAFTGMAPSEVARAHVEIGVPNPSRYVLLTEDIELVIRIGLARDRDDRFETAEELRDAFEDAFAGRLDPAIRDRGRALLEREPWAR